MHHPAPTLATGLQCGTAWSSISAPDDKGMSMELSVAAVGILIQELLECATIPVCQLVLVIGGSWLYRKLLEWLHF